MNTRPAVMWWGLAAVVVAGLLFVPIVLSNADNAPNGFEGYIQSGTCADPSDEFKADLESEDNEYDVEPYVAKGADGESVTLGYNGAPGVPGFSVASAYERATTACARSASGGQSSGISHGTTPRR